MFKSVSRRLSLKLVTLGTFLGMSRQPIAAQTEEGSERDIQRLDRWHLTHDRVWLGREFWANPMEDWRVVDGWAECQTRGANRSIHSLTHQLTDPGSEFSMSVRLAAPAVLRNRVGAGFRIGVRSDINEYRSNCFAKGGIDAGVKGDQLVLGKSSKRIAEPIDSDEAILELQGVPSGDNVQLKLTLISEQGETLGTVTSDVKAADVMGNVALVSQFDGPPKRIEGKGFRFTDWKLGGDAFTVQPDQAFGPILWSMYSLSDSRSDEGFVFKISALTGPLGSGDNRTIGLEVQRGGRWVPMGESELDSDAWVATFRIPNWDQTRPAPYRLSYVEAHRDGSESVSQRTGMVRANPANRPLRLGALTCQNDYAFPYEPVAENLLKLDPDMLYFSGDQLYESHGGFGIIREPAEPAILNYLRKYYQFGWAFGEAMRDRPTLCIPDDHDVFQGNIWGEGGAKMDTEDGGTSSRGGYREPARMVNVVHQTNCGHHPDFFDPTPVKQGISVYYGEMVYGDVGFAVIADRQWKSGPRRVDTGPGRADHVADPDFDTSKLDQEGLVLLGDRQEAFLRQWAEDWRGHKMKVLLSQTVFAGLATHHGNYDGYLKADLDAGAWPQTPRDRAIDLVRPAMALHINGDQHLTSLSQYGVDQQRDSNWSFCTPAIAAGYPRWWRPDEVGMPHDNRPSHGLANTGEFRDGFGNQVYVYAVGNPEAASERQRYRRAHQKGSGFGLVTIDTEAKTYTLEAFRFLVDATDGDRSKQFPGWPVTLHQQENRGENRIG